MGRSGKVVPSNGRHMGELSCDKWNFIGKMIWCHVASHGMPRGTPLVVGMCKIYMTP
jgi:hypothetical protein